MTDPFLDWLEAKYPTDPPTSPSQSFMDEVHGWPSSVQITFGERAAIYQHDAGMTRSKAEFRAYLALRPTA